MKTVTAIARVTGMGHALSAVTVEFKAPMQEAALEALQVQGRTVTKRYFCGNTAVLELNPFDRVPPLRQMVGKPPHMHAEFLTPSAVVIQTEELTDADGNVYPKGETATTAVSYGIIDKYVSGTFTDPATGNVLNYHLYTPENLESGKKYPLVTFIHDAGACSEDKMSGLLQGNGGTVWAEDKEYPCFVLVPHYDHPIVDDDWNTTWEVWATEALIDHIADTNPVSGLYLTGQSMGCMTSMALMIHNPAKWAGAYLVAGQWDTEKLGCLKDNRIWYIVSEGDQKAYPGMQGAIAAWEAAGGTVTKGIFAAVDPNAKDIAADIAADAGNLVCTVYSGDSVIPPHFPPIPGAHHICTWLHAYGLDAVRHWLLRGD